MRRSLILAGAVACLLATAGCLGVLGGESTPTVPAESGPTESSKAAETASPSPVETPTASPTRGAIPLPAGTSDLGSQSPWQFADAHDAALQNTSFTARYSFVRRTDGSVDTRVLGIVQYDGNGTIYYNYTTGDSGSPDRRRIEVWSNGSRARRAITSPNGTIVENVEPVRRVRTFAGRLSVYLRAFETDVAGYSRIGGEPSVRLSGSTFNSTGEEETIEGLAFQLGFEEITAGRISVIVTGDTLQQYEVTITDRTGSSVITVAEELEIRKVGSTTVRRPEWATERRPEWSGPANRSRSG